MQAPFFSIIIPTKNSEKSIGSCIASVVNQRFSDIEVLIIDGTSSDGTISKISDYSKDHSNLKILSEPDKGVYDAMNKGIDLAKGAYLYFLGSDDTLYDDMVLEDIHSRLTQERLPDLLYGNVLWGDTHRLYDGAFDIIKLYRANICHQSIFYSRLVFQKVGKFNLNFPVFADWHFNFRCFASANVEKVYFDRVICRFSLKGISSRLTDQLSMDKRTVFLPIAKEDGWAAYFYLKSISLNRTEPYFLFKYITFKALAHLFRFIELIPRITKGK